jgi:hypothetical protein
MDKKIRIKLVSSRKKRGLTAENKREEGGATFFSLSLFS